MAGSPKQKAKKKYTYADYRSWNDDKRYELIDGVVYDMNAPLRKHQEILVELSRQFANFLKEKSCKVYVAPFDVRLPKKSKKDDKIHTVVQPDISIICNDKKLDKYGCIGAPDLVIEVLSPSTAGKDHIIKRQLYEQHKIKEYWIVDPSNRIVTIYHHNGKTYDKADIYDDNSKITSSVLPDFVLNTKTIFPIVTKKVSSPPPTEYRI